MPIPTNNRSAGGRRIRPGLRVGAISTVAACATVLTLLLAGGAGRPPAAHAAIPGPVLPDLVTRETQESIEKGLEYLVRTQRQDGSWIVPQHYSGYSTVMTSLAGLALMANGSTPEDGPYARQVTKAMTYVLRQARHEDGLIAAPGSGRSMYSHGFSMLFLAQCYGAELNTDYEERLHEVLTKAVELTVASQSDLGANLDHIGGWYYSPGANSDEGSVTVTQLQALRACRNVGITVPISCIDRAVGYLKYCQMGDGGICYAANSRGQSRPSISAAAVACFYAAGIYDRRAGGAGAEAEMVERLWNYIEGLPELNQQGRSRYGHWFYLHFYLAQAMYQRGGAEWNQYYEDIEQTLRNQQNLDGSWSGGIGSVYRTSIAAIIMQLPYGYLPIVQR
ncbi:MAG: prenyltransferase/squalene oxidase repeat-containing protein [Planctomycetota bacterium]|jgi:hypothetical protein